MRFNILSTLIVVTFASNILAQTATIPDNAKAITAPFVFSPESKDKGDQVYQTNCKSCHGDPGKANYAKLVPIPKDPTSAEYQKNSDGEMFFILSNGKGLMPNFANTLTEEQRWNVISYIRSFNKDYKQPPVKVAGEAAKTETAKMVLGYDINNKKLWAMITDSVSGAKKPLPNVTIKLFIKRTFGNLPITQAVTSNLGVAYFDLPKDIPGDSNGNLLLIARTIGSSNELTSTLNEKLGVITKPKLLLDQRAWWSVNKMAPIWLTLLYLSGIVGIGVTILYILLQLRKIRKINQKTTET